MLARYRLSAKASSSRGVYFGGVVKLNVRLRALVVAGENEKPRLPIDTGKPLALFASLCSALPPPFAAGCWRVAGPLALVSSV